ncbi:hypothetical protein G7047_14575 [Diaphorobacter sp. HDW4A]|uniref:ankyrin repeat domain-containing protein n=1 Tax=Diaphorobacter sp. HDW4A TaxID=2714924 RepID=UPI00140A2183|nr:ankyrin repeat domain-containing protein [Diaphorobacter sp. HDW4A]QIL80983.1 hypothetical protein G7047_14575 [Diaphorobacter sp. HDW4A]
MLTKLKKLEQYWWPLTDDNGLDIPLTEITQKNVFGEMPIHIAAWKGTPEDITSLISGGANIEEIGEYGMTPLHYAYMGKKTANVELLIELGANRLAKCEMGLMPHERHENEK